MRRSDIWFFGVVILLLLNVLVLIVFDIELTGWYGLVTEFGVIIFLLPYVFIKMAYMIFPRFKLNTKLFKWLNTDILDNGN